MHRFTGRGGWTLAAFGLALIVGCGEPANQQAGKTNKSENKSGPKTESKTESKSESKIESTKTAGVLDETGHTHDGWWCGGHGIPEDDCSLCLPDEDVKKRFKDTGDWCKKHERAQSQCFKCDPSLYEKKFEPLFVAKYGHKPPRPPKEEFEDDKKEDSKTDAKTESKTEESKK